MFLVNQTRNVCVHACSCNCRSLLCSCCCCRILNASVFCRLLYVSAAFPLPSSNCDSLVSEPVNVFYCSVIRSIWLVTASHWWLLLFVEICNNTALAISHWTRNVVCTCNGTMLDNRDLEISVTRVLQRTKVNLRAWSCACVVYLSDFVHKLIKYCFHLCATFYNLKV